MKYSTKFPQNWWIFTESKSADSFYVMNGDTFFSGDLNLDCDESTIFVMRKMSLMTLDTSKGGWEGEMFCREEP